MPIPALTATNLWRFFCHLGFNEARREKAARLRRPNEIRTSASYSSTTQIAPVAVSPENSDLYVKHPGMLNVYSKLAGSLSNVP